MKNIRIFLKPVGLFLAVFMVILSGPYQSATAALIGTESVINTDRAQNARNRIGYQYRSRAKCPGIS